MIEDPLCFQIFLWANPCGNADQPPPAKLYDIEFCSNYNSYATSGRGIPIEEPGGVCVGELVLRDGGQFYFLHRLYTGNWDNGLKILEKSFEQVRPLILDPEKVRDYLISLRDSSVTALVNLAKSRRRVDCEQARTDAAYAQEQISRTSAQCAQQQQKLATVQRRLASARTELSELTKRIEADRQAVRAMPEVDCLSVDDGVIHIRSIELLCQHPAEEVPRNIGTYNLSLIHI